MFFNNSGAEACELSIKVARKYQSETGHPERYRVIGCHGSFHGRSFATLAAAGAEAYLKGFGPAMDGFDHVAFDNLNEMRAAIGEETAAIMVEPVQGEGGVRAAAGRLPEGAARRSATSSACCSSMTRCSAAWAAPASCSPMNGPGSPPDVMAVAKALGNGFPIGACLATERAAVGMVAGTHGSTFGGNPMAVAAGNAVLDVMLEPGFFERVDATAKLLRGQARSAGPILSEAVRRVARLRPAARHPLRRAGRRFRRQAARRTGSSALTAGDNVLRILPPLIVGEREIDEALDIMDKVAREWPA